MTDREKAIAVLTEHLEHCKSICTKDEVINALAFAIESIKVDRAYDLAYEKAESEVKV